MSAGGPQLHIADPTQAPPEEMEAMLREILGADYQQWPELTAERVAAALTHMELEAMLDIITQHRAMKMALGVVADGGDARRMRKVARATLGRLNSLHAEMPPATQVEYVLAMH